MKDVQDQFVHFDRGFLFTIRELMLRPGHSVREYLAGKRVQHVKPIKFLFWSTATSFFINHFLGFQSRLLQRLEEAEQHTAEQQATNEKLANFLTTHPNILMLMIIPTIALVSWALFRKRQYNYAEYFTMNAYLMGFLSILSIFINAFYYFWDSLNAQQLILIGVLQWMCWAVYYSWAYAELFEKPRNIKLRLGGVLTLFLGYIVLILVIAAIASTVLYFYAPQVKAWLSQ
jgi:hypothetical protein